MRILSVCTSAGLLDKVFVERGHEVIPGCEIMPHKRSMYVAYVGGQHLCEDIADLIEEVQGEHFDLIMGGPPCQARSKLRSIRAPKFPDLTQAVDHLLDVTTWRAFLFENVAPLDLKRECVTTRINAAWFPEQWKGQQLHQSRPRWFTHSPNLPAPEPETEEFEYLAYSIVAGRIYGPKRGAILQGHPEFASINAPSLQLQEALADGVPRGVASAWESSVTEALQ